MQFDNNTTRIRRSILVRLAKLCFEGRTQEGIDRIPIEMRPKAAHHDRCCVHKERAVIRYRLMAMLGYGVEEETDELTPLSEYAARALERDHAGRTGLTVIDEACSACIHANYFITNACRGCYARPCKLNCPKKCISFVDGKAAIDPQKCVNCGKCMKVCPYHAIVYIPIPCEEECPVGAISKDESGREIIDDSKCILCAKCMSACPFGAIMDKSQVMDVIKWLLSDRPVVAMIAPSIVGQFEASLEQVNGALKKLGFDHVMEVASGADVTAQNEAAELEERMANGDSFMTTSCCPAFVETVEKHVPILKPFVSHTGTPMHYTAELASNQHPEAIRVFIGPCPAKRREAARDELVDYALTFEELGSMLVAKGINVEEAEPVSTESPASASGRGFPISGGVAGAVMDMASDENDSEVRPEFVNGISEPTIRALKNYASSPGEFNLLEVMCCEGGCISGPCVIEGARKAAKRVQDLKLESSKPSK
jgi:[FeFe] hydrogenase (group B1/B3)